MGPMSFHRGSRVRQTRQRRQTRPSRLSLAGCAAAIALTASAASWAIVTQVDGTVVPTFNSGTCPGAVNDCVQTALNVGEGLAATATNNPVEQVESAALSPEVFQVPKDGAAYRTVEFWDLQEGAGYENTFGWYNIDDPTTLHAVLVCGDEPGDTRNVNFETEFQAARYHGGYIGFFMISPDNPDNNIDWGDPCGRHSPPPAVATTTTIFTEAALNGDGNYVHYLVYESVVANDAYYFAFEDLWHGGDNDFDDMLIKVTGLLKPCVPSAEICDGDDNNCDGLIDNAPVDAGGQCGTTDEGVCEFGEYECQNGGLVCVGEVTGSGEICDGLDNDCDGTVDDSPSDVGAACGESEGECEPGTTECISGVPVCVGGLGKQLEICDTKDNDCDGETDEDTIDAGGACGTNVGECTPGVIQCVAGDLECSGGIGEVTEECNGLDDDCDGLVDEEDPGGGGACGPDEGQCEPGVNHCIDGVIECVGARGGTDEICDGLDNDCDGEADTLAVCPGESLCIEGGCAQPCGGGEFVCPGGYACRNGYCVPKTCEGGCPDGQECSGGVCVPVAATGGAGGGGAAGTTGGAGTAGSAGAGGSTAPGGPGDPLHGTAGDGTAAAEDTSGQNWGLPSGGGGCSAARGGGGSTGFLGIAAGLLALAWARRKRRPKEDALAEHGRLS